MTLHEKIAQARLLAEREHNIFGGEKLAEALAIAVGALERMQEPTGEGSYDALRIIRSNAREAIMEIKNALGEVE